MVDMEGFCRFVVQTLEPQIAEYGMVLDRLSLRPLPPQPGVKDDLFLLYGVVTAEYLPDPKAFAVTVDKKYMVVAGRETAENLANDVASQLILIAMTLNGGERMKKTPDFREVKCGKDRKEILGTLDGMRTRVLNGEITGIMAVMEDADGTYTVIGSGCEDSRRYAGALMELAVRRLGYQYVGEEL